MRRFAALLAVTALVAGLTAWRLVDVKPDPNAQAVADGCQRVYDKHGDARGERELRQVEDELDQRHAAFREQDQCAPEQAPEHDPVGTAEEQAEHERDVSQ